MKMTASSAIRDVSQLNKCDFESLLTFLLVVHICVASRTTEIEDRVAVGMSILCILLSLEYRKCPVVQDELHDLFIFIVVFATLWGTQWETRTLTAFILLLVIVWWRTHGNQCPFYESRTRTVLSEIKAWVFLGLAIFWQYDGGDLAVAEKLCLTVLLVYFAQRVSPLCSKRRPGSV